MATTVPRFARTRPAFSLDSLLASRATETYGCCRGDASGIRAQRLRVLPAAARRVESNDRSSHRTRGCDTTHHETRRTARRLRARIRCGSDLEVEL